MSKRKKHNLPKFVKPYGEGKYQVVIARKHLKYSKAPFETSKEAHTHALNMLEKAADDVLTSNSHEEAVAKIVGAVQKAGPGHVCEECGFSQPERFFKCPKCGGYKIGKMSLDKVDADAVLREHAPEPVPPQKAAPVPSCGNCIHACVCRLKHDHIAGLLEIVKQFYAKADVGTVRQLMGCYCEYHRRKG